jgi:hypothetical protein
MYWVTSEELEDDPETRARSQRDNGNKDVQQLGEKVLASHVSGRDKRAISRGLKSSRQVGTTLCATPNIELRRLRRLAEPAVAGQPLRRVRRRCPIRSDAQ